MIRILFFIPNLSVGGAEKVLVNLVNNLDITKFDITIQTLFAGGVNEQFLNKNIKYKSCFPKEFKGNSHVFKLFSPKCLYKHFIRDKYDIIISYLEGPTARIVSGCTDINTKKICWIHCRFDSMKTAAVGFRSFEEAKKSFDTFDHIVCVSKMVQKSFVDIVGYKGSTSVLYNTNETEIIKQKSQYKINDSRFNNSIFTICSVGKIESVKGFDRLARVHKRLKDSGYQNVVYVLGEGSQKESLVSILKQNNITDSFVLLGYKTNPYKYLAQSDLYVCSSLSEGFSTAATEALILGVPVCTVDVSGMKEMLGVNNEYGIVTDNNEESLFNGIKMLLDNPKLLAHYKEKAKERGQMFSTKKTVRAVEDMLLSL